MKWSSVNLATCISLPFSPLLPSPFSPHFSPFPPSLLPPSLSAGNCSPRYMRATMYTVPCSKDLLNTCRVPMGLVIQPLADIPPQEVSFLCNLEPIRTSIECI